MYILVMSHFELIKQGAVTPLAVHVQAGQPLPWMNSRRRRLLQNLWHPGFGIVAIRAGRHDFRLIVYRIFLELWDGGCFVRRLGLDSVERLRRHAGPFSQPTKGDHDGFAKVTKLRYSSKNLRHRLASAAPSDDIAALRCPNV